ncbi:MAG: hypothetical protein KME26_14095 [Oscillatoria princeps RMCB-10]|nr:hypothetical protein [Oscillatoria princeps RMCB-10]
MFALCLPVAGAQIQADTWRASRKVRRCRTGRYAGCIASAGYFKSIAGRANLG